MGIGYFFLHYYYFYIIRSGIFVTGDWRARGFKTASGSTHAYWQGNEPPGSELCSSELGHPLIANEWDGRTEGRFLATVAFG